MEQENKTIKDEILEAMKSPESDTPDDGWLSTNESVETVSDFEMLAEQLNRVTNDRHRWKWAIIALHSGLQGLMVLALRGSAGFNVLRESHKRRLKDRRKRDENEIPRQRDSKLVDFLELYRRIKGRRMLMYTDSRKFVPNGTQGRSIKMLNRLRNDFIHFTPKVWGLDLGGLPEIALDCLEIAEFLAWESGNVLWHEASLRDGLESAFKSAHRSLCTLGRQRFLGSSLNPVKLRKPPSFKRITP